MEYNALAHEDPTSERSSELALAVLLGCIALLASVDIAIDLSAGGGGLHVATEAAVVALAIAATAWLASRLARRARRLRARLADTEAAARRWREEAQSVLRGLGAFIDAQFTRWSLSHAEKETALLLLKGLSHKEIARARGISDATARQQAGAVYRKAGVAGRSELAAFFLEDLALPPEPQAPLRATGETAGT